MSNLLGMSFDGSASPSIRLKGWQQEDLTDEAPTGWGFGWYPAGESGAVVVKDPIPTGDTALSRLLRDWERFRATEFVCHIRGAAKRASQADTHPFTRSYGGRDWLFAHNGQLDPEKVRDLPLGDPPLFEPVGRTDSEHAFCWLMGRLRMQGARRLANLGWHLLHGWLRELNALGTLNVLMSDGHDLVAYRDANGFNDLHWIRRSPPHQLTKLVNKSFELDLGHPLDANRTMVLVTTKPASNEEWKQFQTGQCLVVRRGSVIWNSHEEIPGTTTKLVSSAEFGKTRKWSPSGVVQSATSVRESSQELVTEPPPQLMLGASIEAAAEIPEDPVVEVGTFLTGARPPMTSRVMSVVHETIYRYSEAVEHSTQVLRLKPNQDFYQDVLEHELLLTPKVDCEEFEDVFGNQVTRAKIRQPYTELKIVSRSLVRVKRDHPDARPVRRTPIPLVWMPWQRQMMASYLLPPELPETQLRELSEYAMSFVERQDYDLVTTLNDINTSIYRDFSYMSKSTTLETTPFDVYVTRRGVCQDFANLFICLARLLGVPARYRVGYIYTGGDYENKVQSDASHAWLEVYLPRSGWQGYDPTNGCLANLDHVRVAVGRNFRDATPTSGTIYKGGGGEVLSVSVRVEPVDAQIA